MPQLSALRSGEEFRRRVPPGELRPRLLGTASLASSAGHAAGLVRRVVDLKGAALKPQREPLGHGWTAPKRASRDQVSQPTQLGLSRRLGSRERIVRLAEPDKFMSSGQNVAIKGMTVGYYLFKRCAANRRV